MARKSSPITTVAILLSFVLLCFSGTVQAQIIYVDADVGSAGNGSSWTDAYNHLQDALTAAVIGDEIRVAQGIYKPDQGDAITLGDRMATFQLISGVGVNGGYAGSGEPDPNARDVELYQTILSGDLAGDDGPNFAYNTENSYQVIIGSGTDATAVLDGVTITAGNANGTGTYGYGSGVYNDHGSPTMTNCTVRENWARFGGGIYDVNSSPTLTDCAFNGNLSDAVHNLNSSPTLTGCSFSGNFKAMHNDNSSPMLTDCTFTDNERGMYNVGSNPTLVNCSFSGHNGAMSSWAGSSPTLTNCIFSQNSSNSNGGAMYNENANPVLTDCAFTANSASASGGAMYNYSGSPTLTDCTFIENSAGLHGGAIRNFNSNAVLTNCTFNANSANDEGGAIGNSQSSPILTNCSFRENLADQGGGMYNLNADPNLTGCSFTANSAGWSGGGMGSSSGSPVLTNCTFSANSAFGGGGMENSYNSPVLNNCLFSGNSAEYGGGMKNFNNNLTLANCTFTGNFANYGGGGILISHFSTLTLTSCIFWGNIADNGPDEIWDDDEITVTISYSDVKGGWPGVENIDADPFFVSPGYWDTDGHWVEGDYHLLPDSPCLDAGDPAYIPAPGETDLDGQPRVIDGRIDMGVYEHTSAVLIEVGITPGVINLKSRGSWITALLSFPEGYSVSEVNTERVFLQGDIQPQVWVWFDEESREIMVRFRRDQVQSVLSVGNVEVTIAGRFMDGTPFKGTGVVKVINKGGGKPPK